jgi:hypothetical protein
MEAPSIFVAVPAYGGSIRTQCVHAIIDLLQHLWNRKIRAAYETIDNAEIAAARNFLASRFYYSGFSHLLFVDGDMVFSAADVERLVAADKPLIGAVYPHRHNFPLLHAIALGRELEPARALAMATRFVVYYQGETGQKAEFDVLDGICRVGGLGMGLALISPPCSSSCAQPERSARSSAISSRISAWISRSSGSLTRSIAPMNTPPRTWPFASAGGSCAAARSGRWSHGRSGTSARWSSTPPISRSSKAASSERGGTRPR